jgi:hypothetical protein
MKNKKPSETGAFFISPCFSTAKQRVKIKVNGTMKEVVTEVRGTK